MWKEGDAVRHRYNPELGIGTVSAVEARAVVVRFPGDVLLRIGSGGDVLAPGATEAQSLEERLALGDVDPGGTFANRLLALHLLERREARGLGSFLGGRIRLFPHQLYAAERATAADPVRWLLADEVGLGKTIEACLILNRLVNTGRAQRCLIVAPDTLAVQWLGELWRKYHQSFVLLDERRLADVARDFGADFNPFDVHRRAILSLEALCARPRLTEQAVAAGIDLLVVDEAHRLRRPPGHPGDPAFRAVAPIVAGGRHVLLLTATPFEDDAHGFFRLLQLLQPAEFPEDVDFEARLASRTPLPPCTSSTRRSEIGGLPPRVRVPVATPGGAWERRLELERAVRSADAPNAVARRQKSDRIRRALASGAALRAVLGSDEDSLKKLADAADAEDPRIAWLAREGPAWKEAGQKTLVFVAHRETLELLRKALGDRSQLASGVFHEDLSAARRDMEVALFRRPEGPSLLVSTECGGEGRNFEFCDRLVLFDLPWNPVVVEQRIGRLDRIGRRIPVAIATFESPEGLTAEVVRLHAALGLFREPLAGLEPELASVEPAIDAAALDPDGVLSGPRFDAIVSGAQRGIERIHEAAYQELHRAPYRAAMADSILARVPGDLDALNEEVLIEGCGLLGFGIERQRGRSVYSIDFGNEALVDSLPGVAAGASFLGTFDREEAVENETLDYFAAGHPLLEGVLAQIEDGSKGRVAVLELEADGPGGIGLAAFYKDGPAFEVVAFDEGGVSRPDWAAALRERPLPAHPLHPDSPERVRALEAVPALAESLPKGRRPVALAAFIVA